MQVRGAPRTLHPGEPLCAPVTTVIVEALILLLRQLHRCGGWTAQVNRVLVARLQSVSHLVKVIAGEGEGGMMPDVEEEEEGEEEGESETKEEGKKSIDETREKTDREMTDIKEKEDKSQLDGRNLLY